MSAKVPLRPVLAALSEGRSFKPLEKEAYVAPSAGEDDSQRSHGRCLGELPPLFFTLDSHPNHSGSAFFAIGETRVSAAVSGPHPRVLQASGRFATSVNKGQKDAVTLVAASRLDATIELSIQLAPFASGSYTAIAGRQSTSITEFLSECLEGQSSSNEQAERDIGSLRSLAEAVMETLRSTIRTNNYPNSKIQITALILSYDRSLLFPAVVNTISLALLDAKITISDVLASCISYVVKMPESNPYCCLALEDEELQRIRRSGGEITTITLAMLTSRGLIAYIDMAGIHLQPPYDQQSIALAESACLAIAKEMSNCIQLHCDTT